LRVEAPFVFEAAFCPPAFPEAAAAETEEAIACDMEESIDMEVEVGSGVVVGATKVEVAVA